MKYLLCLVTDVLSPALPVFGISSVRLFVLPSSHFSRMQTSAICSRQPVSLFRQPMVVGSGDFWRSPALYDALSLHRS